MALVIDGRRRKNGKMMYRIWLTSEERYATKALTREELFLILLNEAVYSALQDFSGAFSMNMSSILVYGTTDRNGEQFKLMDKWRKGNKNPWDPKTLQERDAKILTTKKEIKGLLEKLLASELYKI